MKKSHLLVIISLYLTKQKGRCQMERNIMQELVSWKNLKKDRMPLLLYGVRQVGKTYILR